ncbi:SUMF1/EgtB/PvdO family nonheme iron enzyme [Streptomyces hyaluromycini]|uniref:SUMF1/EgtB/PvdO family nonheme iron enzyme n=1 Tax=Streptomyces hyaluromycini TaxID=1377993 RepID=A0ABV1X6E0_9ACTN
MTRETVLSPRTEQWVVVEAGPFTIGLDEKKSDGRHASWSPAHTVHVDTFSISRTPVSVAEFARFVAETGHRTLAERQGYSYVWVGGEDTTTAGQDHLWWKIDGAYWQAPRGPESDVADKADHPVTHVDYADCLAYCEWSGTRLPTEVEWEKAARGTDGRMYPWGDTPPTPDSCNHSMFVGDTTPIGSYPDAGGPHGLADIVGNVWEWTSSLWQRYPFGSTEPRVIVTKSGTRLELGVFRGGSFFNDCTPRWVSPTTRCYTPRNYSCYDLGFRVCRS